MPGVQHGIWDLPIASTPVAIIDFETTGLSPRNDRVIEISIVRADPGRQPQMVLDTLVNPHRPVSATEIHGITDRDVEDAPKFDDIAGHVLRGLHGCVVASYNVNFDIGFLKAELRRLGLSHVPPHFCLMYMRPMLDLGKRCSLQDACKAHGIHHSEPHFSSTDAFAAARLWVYYLQTIAERRLETFRDLSEVKTYKFVDSFEFGTFPSEITVGLRCGSTKARLGTATPATSQATKAPGPNSIAQRLYWEAMKTVLVDMTVTDEEVAYLAQKRHELRLTPPEYRCLHARAFADIMLRTIDDSLLTDPECATLKRLHQCLSKMGWAPGE